MYFIKLFCFHSSGVNVAKLSNGTIPKSRHPRDHLSPSKRRETLQRQQSCPEEPDHLVSNGILFLFVFKIDVFTMFLTFQFFSRIKRSKDLSWIEVLNFPWMILLSFFHFSLYAQGWVLLKSRGSELEEKKKHFQIKFASQSNYTGLNSLCRA